VIVTARRSVPHALLALLLLACTRYQPQPLDLTAHPAEYRVRHLSDAAILSLVTEFAGAISDSGWTDRQLALAALRFRPELSRARAEWRAARAGEVSAGARPQPGAQADVERAVSGADGASPWAVSLAGLYSVELGGKRGARVAQAHARTAVAEAELRLVAWQVVSQVRSAVVDSWRARQELADAEIEAETLEQIRALTESRYREAVLTSSELARAGGEVQAARTTVSEARGALLTSEAGLSRAIAVPAAALDSVRLASPTVAGCEWLDSLGRDSVEATALRSRAEVSQALARYALAEADLRQQVAQQYPDLELGPGFIWDQGVHRWTLLLTLPRLLLNRNRGPIAEAVAQRTAAAARVAEAQEQVLGETGAGQLGCGAAGVELAAADTQLVAAERAAQLAGLAFQRGETGRIEVAQAELSLLRARRTQHAARRRLVGAGLEIEHAAGVWHENAARWPDPRLEYGAKAESQ
jgi:cobalt-zinc-cadmium efflux system outer membrane protein